MATPLALWTEIVGDSSASALVLNQALDSGDTHRIWDASSDESLKSIMSLINPMLNETKTRQRGLMLLTRFMDQLDPLRYIGIQDALTSTFHLCLKSLDLSMAQRFFAKVLPHCRKLPELSQTITSGIVPKILSNFCEVSKSSHPSSDEMALLRVCLDKYHGPCGNQRANLEKFLVTLIDKIETSEEDIELIGAIMPLLSAAGGGGNSGEKHSADWSQMVIRILRAIYDCLVLLYGDASPMFETENPFQTELPKLALPEIRERNVFLRISLIKTRLLNLASVLGHYLKDPFPAPKPVPMRSIFSVVRKMTTLNPVDLLSSFATAPKEYIYLSFVLPSIHQAGFNLLGSLMKSVGGNFITEAVLFEQLTLQEFKWMAEQPTAFVELKLEIYRTIVIWLCINGASVANDRVSIAWARQIQRDTQIEKDTIELNPTGRSKGSKKGMFKAPTKTQFVSASLNSSGVQNIKSKDSDVCFLALKSLSLLIPALDPGSHKMIYHLLGKIATEITELPSFPSPYDNVECRKQIHECISSLARHANPFSPISLSLSIKIADKGKFDNAVASTSRQVSSILERITHPICPSFNFPTISTALTSDVAETHENETAMDTEPEVPEIQATDTSCQTDEIPSNSSMTMSPQAELELQDRILFAIKNSFNLLLPGFPQALSSNFQVRNENSARFSVDEDETDGNSSVVFLDDTETEPNSPVRSRSPNLPVENGYGKRKEISEQTQLEDSENTSNSENSVSKKFKGAETEAKDELNVEDMLKDFVGTGPEN